MFQKKSILLLLGMSALFLLITLGIIIPKIGGLTYPSIIHFDKWNGVNFLGDQVDFLGILLTGIVFIALNVFLGSRLFHKERFVAYLFLTANVLISILLLVFSATVIGNN
jgi:hypothetical protein